MSDECGLLQCILENPNDDSPRLVYADWLEDSGDPENVARAEFIRVQCALNGAIPEYFILEATELAYAKKSKRPISYFNRDWIQDNTIEATFHPLLPPLKALETVYVDGSVYAWDLTGPFTVEGVSEHGNRALLNVTKEYSDSVDRSKMIPQERLAGLLVRQSELSRCGTVFGHIENCPLQLLYIDDNEVSVACVTHTVEEEIQMERPVIGFTGKAKRGFLQSVSLTRSQISLLPHILEAHPVEKIECERLLFEIRHTPNPPTGRHSWELGVNNTFRGEWTRPRREELFALLHRPEDLFALLPSHWPRS